MRGAAKLLLASALLAGVSATEISSKAEWEDKTAGKTVFVKFLAPWCGHCKSLKPAWDELAAEYEGNANVAIVDVDCTAGGKDLCSEHGVRGYPTIKSGDPADLQDYKGGRTLDAIKEHAATLGPTCSPSNIDLCDEDKKKKIAELTAMSDADREKQIKESEETMEKVEKDFTTFVEGLNKAYKESSEKKEKTLADIKNSGMGLLKAVHKFEAKKNGEL